eukprot:708139-Pelagomonas_calceolata.AAC.1
MCTSTRITRDIHRDEEQEWVVQASAPPTGTHRPAGVTCTPIICDIHAEMRHRKRLCRQARLPQHGDEAQEWEPHENTHPRIELVMSLGTRVSAAVHDGMHLTLWPWLKSMTACTGSPRQHAPHFTAMA